MLAVVNLSFIHCELLVPLRVILHSGQLGQLLEVVADGSLGLHYLANLVLWIAVAQGFLCSTYRQEAPS